MTTVAVLDAGSGNVRSAVRALEAAGAEVQLTAQPQYLLSADGLVVPGVGAFASVMDELRAVGAPAIIRERIERGMPVLGICVGLQVMFDQGTEHGLTAEGLGLWNGSVTKLSAPVVPHMGWTTVRPPQGSLLFNGITDEHFYFVHSYAAHTAPSTGEATYAEHGEKFIAAVEDGPLSAVQFHPEKSGSAGLKLLANWIAGLDDSHT